MGVVVESCNLCHEEWLDLDVKHSVCSNCRKGSQPVNNIYPGDGASHLPEITQIEEMLMTCSIVANSRWSNEVHWSHLQFSSRKC